jgi:uncharacterized protein (DUF58 family)
MTHIKGLLSALTLTLALLTCAFLLTTTAFAEENTEEPPPAPAVTEAVIPNGENAFTPPGGGTVLDDASEADGKEFFTITATDGSVYYLIIDRRRGSENVYFLSAVTKEDLLGLAQSAGAVSVPGLVPVYPSAPQTPTSEPPETAAEQPKQTAKSGGTGTVIFIILAAIAAGGAGYYFKIVRPRKQTASPEEDEDFGEDMPEEPREDTVSDGTEYFFTDDGEEQQENE